MCAKTWKVTGKKTKGYVQRQMRELLTITLEGWIAHIDKQALPGQLHPYVQSEAQIMSDLCMYYF